MSAATVWWARTDSASFGTTNIGYDFPTQTLSGRATVPDAGSGSFLLTFSYWLPIANFPSTGCRFRSTPGANFSGDASAGTQTGEMFGLIELSGPQAQCQLRATQQIFAGPSLIATGTNLHDITSAAGDFQFTTGHLPSQPFPTLDFDLDRTQNLAIQLQLSFENTIVHSYQCWWGFPAICSLPIAQWDIVSIA